MSNAESSTPLDIVILAAGLGTRMRSDRPKVLHEVAGFAMLTHVLRTAEALGPRRIVVVTGPDQPDVAAAAAPHGTAIQPARRGTADALKAARGLLTEGDGDVLVLYGDSPLVTTDTVRRMVAARHSPARPAAVVLGVTLADPTGYGRLIVGDDGLEAIVEQADATAEQDSITLCNGGIMCLDQAGVWARIDRIGAQNAKGEYYLTDLIGLYRAEGRRCAVVEGDAEEFLGVNSRAELAQVEALFQRRLRDAAMEGGATLVDPASVHLAADTVLGRDVVIEPHVVFGPGVTIGDRVTVRAFCHLEAVEIAEAATIGPFARLRGGSVIGAGARFGSFVEGKKVTLGAGAKAPHLSYLGDTTVGAGANVGAGTITCNYDGFAKHRTEIGARAFIGSNSALVAPVTVGEGAIIGAGSVITHDVLPDALAVARGRQREIEGWADRFRRKRERTRKEK